MRYGSGHHRFGRLGLTTMVAAGAFGVAAFASASGATTTRTVKSFAPKTGSVGTKVTIKGTDLDAVSAVTWVIYPGPKDYAAKFTKTATSIVATAPAAFPTKPGPGLIQLKAGTDLVTVDCWGAC